MAPYERRVTELLKVGRDKRALKLLKKRVSSSSKNSQVPVRYWKWSKQELQIRNPIRPGFEVPLTLHVRAAWNTLASKEEA